MMEEEGNEGLLGGDYSPSCSCLGQLHLDGLTLEAVVPSFGWTLSTVQRLHIFPTGKCDGHKGSPVKDPAREVARKGGGDDGAVTSSSLSAGGVDARDDGQKGRRRWGGRSMMSGGSSSSRRRKVRMTGTVGGEVSGHIEASRHEGGGGADIEGEESSRGLGEGSSSSEGSGSSISSSSVEGLTTGSILAARVRKQRQER